jgi:hypothetical protein
MYYYSKEMKHVKLKSNNDFAGTFDRGLKKVLQKQEVHT